MFKRERRIIMNFPEKYIKMCKETEEIQALCPKREDGNYIYAKKENNGWDIYITSSDFYWLDEYGNGKKANKFVYKYWESDYPYYFSEWIWLPTQDQLQKIVKDRWSSWTELLEEFGEYVKSRRWLDYTPEMYWLHFVMEKKFNKTWNEQKQKWEIIKNER